MVADAYEFKESRDRKTIYPDAYHPPGIRAVPGIIPLAFLTIPLVTLLAGLSSKKEETRWIASGSALFFGAFGVLTSWMWWKKAQLDRLRERADDAVMKDYPWNRHHCVILGTDRLKTSLTWAAVMTCIMFVFNVWILRNGPDSFAIVHLVILAFDLLVLWMWCKAAYHWLQARKFGASRVEYLRFPYSVREPVRLRWIVPRNVTNAQSAVFTLRCIHERTEHFIKNGERSAQIVNEEWWAGEWSLTRPERWTPGECIELEWEPMPGLPGTRLNAEEIYFWRLDVRMSLPGTDFFAGYLVPVYAE